MDKSKNMISFDINRVKKILIAVCILSHSCFVFAVEDIAVFGLIGEKALLRIDRVNRILPKGETSPEGVKLIAIADDKRSITLEIEGVEQIYRLGFGTDTGVNSLNVAPDNSGMYRVSGKINGIDVPFVVDTGATFVTLNKHIANQLGIDYQQSTQKSLAETANGEVSIFMVTLDEVQVGDITLKKVQAAIHDSDFPSVVLLGMSFLNQVDISRTGTILYLEQN